MISRIASGMASSIIRRKRLGRARAEVIVACAFLAMVVVATIAAPAVAPFDPTETSMSAILKPPVWQGGSWVHPFGTDSLGRDILSRVIYGGRVSLVVGALAVLLGGTAGVLLGLVSGYVSGPVSAVIMRAADVQLAVPFLLLALGLMAAIGPGIGNVIAVLALGQWVEYARVVRGEVLSLREREFVEAARVIGQTDRLILLRHLLPNVMPNVTVIATLSVGAAILSEASLTFLGVGVGIETPSWGGMISEGRAYMTVAGWVSAVPGLVLMLTILAMNVLGDWLHDRADPKLRSR